MAARVIGLDVGTHAVRVAEVEVGEPPRLAAVGQVGLPRGAVDHGEVVDPEAVAAALRRLWREVRVRGRRVRVGMANLRTIVRQVELPAMDESELRGALTLQAGEFIPLPPEATQLDFRVLESFTSDEGEAMVRVLIAAVHRESVEQLLTAVRAAGLQASAVDLVPFALVRSLGLGAPLLGAPDAPEAPGGVGGPAASAEAIVSVGAGVTVVVVHEVGVPRFVRIVDTGGDDLTAAVAQALGLSFEEAEAQKRQLGAGVEGRADASAALEASLRDLTAEIRGSLDFYTSQSEARPLSRVLVTGGGALVEGFTQGLADVLDAPVEWAQPRDRLFIGDIGFSPDEIEALDPYLPVPVGLALGGAPGVAERINLLPGRERMVVEARRAVLGGAAVVAALVVVLVVLSLGRLRAIDDERSRLAVQERVNQQLNAEIQSLRDAQELQDQVDTARGLVAEVLATDVSWARVLQEMARVIPSDVWLESFSGSLEAAEAAEAGLDAIRGAATFSGKGIDFPSAAAWLQRIATVPSFESPWVSQINRGEFDGFDVINFNATASVGPESRSERSRRARDEAGVPDRPEPGPAEGGAT